jgi:hypothetical protein
LEGVDRSEVRDAVVGTEGLYCARLPDGFSRWRKTSLLHEGAGCAYDVTLFEDLGDGRTKLTFIGNEPMESAKNSGQMEGWIQILDKVAAVVAELAQAK